MTSRRDLLQKATLAAAGAGLPASVTASGAASAGKAAIRPELDDLSFLGRSPLLNRERVSALMREEGLAALVLARAPNVYYATNFLPLTDRMSSLPSCLAVIPRDPTRPVALVVPQFSYYYVQSDDGLPPGVQAFPFTSPRGEETAAAGAEPEAAPPLLFRVVDPERLTAREKRRRAALDAAAPLAASMRWAMSRAARELGLAGGRIGQDDPLAARMIGEALPEATVVPGDDTLRRARMVRTAAEVQLMHIAAQNNAEAAMATALVARELGSLRALRAHFFAESARRGNTGVFMVIDGASSEGYDEPLREGRSIMIDCVSHCRHYHGDYARTIHIGEPSRDMARATEAIGKAWDEIRERLRPGLRFSEIRTLGTETLRKLGYDYGVGFAAHSVGLQHSDQPRAAVDGGPVDHRLEAGMILSVDCPLFDAGRDGSAHFEDLVLVKRDGVELLHESGPRTYVV